MVNRLKPLWEKHHTKGFEILGIGASSRDTQAAQIAYCKSVGIKWVELFDANGKVLEMYAVRAFPTMILVGPDGKVLIANAYRGWNDVVKYVEANCTEEYVEVAKAPESNGEVRRRLNGDGPALAYEDTPLSEVVKNLTESTGVPFTADDKAQALLDSESASITLSGGKLKDILDLLAATHGLTYEVKENGIHLSTEPEPEPDKYLKDSDEYAKFMEIAKQVLPGSHKALDADSVTAAIADMRNRDLDRMEQMVNALSRRARGDERTLLRDFRTMLGDAQDD